MAHSAAATTERLSIGHYELRQCLGEGGFGRVYEAWDQLLCRNVALKCINGTPCQSTREKLIAEARLAASLHHPAFVRIFGVEDDGRSQYIVMELIRGDTLRAHEGNYAAATDRALCVIDQVAAAMAEAHGVNLVHGDLKPANLMVEASGAVRILDFGLGRHIDPLATESGTPDDPQGTIAYMAPERLAGRPSSPATDMYSLGVVLYELVTGERPFAALQGLALAAAHMQSSSERWQFPAGIDKGLLDLILSMTARDPAGRPPSMHALRQRITRLQAPAGANTPSSAPVRSKPRWSALRRSLSLIMLVLTVATIPALDVAVPGNAVEPDSSPHWSESAAMNAGLRALRRSDRDGAIEEALRSFDAILARQPGHAGAAAGQSLAYSMRYVGDGRDETWLRRAAAGAHLALERDDQLALAHAAQAWVDALSGRENEALSAADRALTLDPRELQALDVKINTLLRMQRHDEARAVIELAKQRMPRERTFADLEGTLHYQQGDYVRAEQAFRHSLELEPDGVFGYANLGATLLRQSRRDEALSVLQQGLRIQPSGVLYSNLGTALYDGGDYTGASAAFERAVSAAKGGPNDYLKWANLADALRWVPGREAASQAAYRRAVQLLRPQLARSPSDPTFLTRMGLYAAHLDDQVDALTWTERGIAAAPSNPDVHYRAARAYELRGRRDAALEHLARAAALGYPFSMIEAEPELVALRRDSRYQTLALDHTP